MTKEQAIERLKKMIQINNGVIKEARKNGDIFAMQLTADLDTDSIAIEKVLTMLEEKDKQIDKLKKHNDELLRKLRNRVKEVKKLEKYSLYKEEFSRLNKQLQNKDKIIDLMANHIATSDSDLCEYLDITTKCKYYAGDNGKTCDNCIKQYFENKAKELLNK
jgi:uncharacterized membrane protein YgaE (UPF0421/DUF939 family)|nr:MAG TPA: nuclear pore complex protein [Caudoviricetes sp.]